jgi:hypothetical protein
MEVYFRNPGNDDYYKAIGVIGVFKLFGKELYYTNWKR